MSRIYKAVWHGTLQDLAYWIQHGDDVNAPDTTGQHFPLVEAAGANKYKMVKLLLESGADVNVADRCDNTTALYYAKKFSNQAMLDLIHDYRKRDKQQLMAQISSLACSLLAEYKKQSADVSRLSFITTHADSFYKLDTLFASLLDNYQSNEVDAFIQHSRKGLPLQQSLLTYVRDHMSQPDFLMHLDLLKPDYYSPADHADLVESILFEIRTTTNVDYCQKHWMELLHHIHQHVEDFDSQFFWIGYEGYYATPDDHSCIGFLGQLMLNNNRSAFEFMLDHGMDPDTTQYKTGSYSFSALKIALMLHLNGQDPTMFFARKLFDKLGIKNEHVLIPEAKDFACTVPSKRNDLQKIIKHSKLANHHFLKAWDEAMFVDEMLQLAKKPGALFFKSRKETQKTQETKDELAHPLSSDGQVLR